MYRALGAGVAGTEGELKDVYGEMVGNDAGEEGQGRVHRTFSAMLEFLAFTLLAKGSL